MFHFLTQSSAFQVSLLMSYIATLCIRIFLSVHLIVKVVLSTLHSVSLNLSYFDRTYAPIG